MPQNRPCDVRPWSEQDKYSLALQDQGGRWYGIDAPLNNIIPTTMGTPEALSRVGFASFHQGRGADKYTQEDFRYYDGMNLWSTTPGKAHATQLFRWAKGLRNADFNMPNANGVTWKPLLQDHRYMAVSFVASASYTVQKIIILIRKRVPAGATGVPGTLRVHLCLDIDGAPWTAIESMTITASDVDDVTSQYYVLSLSEAITSGSTYWLVFQGYSADRLNACWEVGCDPTVEGLRSGSGTLLSYTDTDLSPYYRVTDADAAQTLKMFTWDDALYAVSVYDDGSTSSKLYLNGVRGRAVGTQSSTTLQDTGHGTYGATSWPTNRFAGCTVRIIRGTGKGQTRTIASNTGDTFTVTEAWTTTPVDGSSEYVVYGSDWFVEIGSTGLGVVTGDPCIQNGTVYFPQGDSTDMRIMRLDYSDADDHAFDVENTKHNKATFLTAGYDGANGPQIWRANLNATTGSTPNASAISVSRASSAPLSGGVPTPLAFGTDLTFARAIPCGDNTNLINNIIFHDGALYVLKDDSIFLVQNDIAAQIKIGTDRAPRRTNGLAAAVGSDKQLYIGFLSDVYLLTGGGVYPTGLKTNLASDRSGFASDLASGEGWLFAALNAGSGTSSVMKYSMDTRTWSEQLRAFATGRQIRGVCWQDLVDARPRLWVDIAGELIYQEFPLNGTRPYDDPGQKYQHEAVLVLPTIDLNNVDPKYYATLTITSQGLAQDDDTETGHEIVVEYQTDNNVGTSNWQHGGYIRRSPSGSVNLNVGDTRMLRPRLRLISSEASDPVIVETIGLTLFSRTKLSHQWQVYFITTGDDEEQNSMELLRWLRDSYLKAEPLRLFSRFRLYDDIRVTLTDYPYYRLDELDQEVDELEAQIGITLREIL